MGETGGEEGGEEGGELLVDTDEEKDEEEEKVGLERGKGEGGVSPERGEPNNEEAINK